ncbi:MAG TPA: IS4 family transposase, partial [Pseudonocardiaceae bacterium]|nr:IS4 family transposase [Pseudonocardiaceae bacterium]
MFAPGHLGELTRYLPFELVDDVLVQTRTVQQRLRALPSRTGVYFVLALALFPQIGYARVWAKLCAGLAGLTGTEHRGLAVSEKVSEKALRELRRRLGPAPFKMLFEIVAGPLAQPRTPGVCFAGLRTVAFDGLNSIKIPDSQRNRSWLGKVRYKLVFAGYPTLRLLCLIETGTRGLLGAALGGVLGQPGDRDESHLARRLLGLLRPGMLLLADRAYDSGEFLVAVDQTGAKLLVRGGATRKPAVLHHLRDGSYLSEIAGLAVRIIEADLTARGADGTLVGDRYRLITTLLDEHTYPAANLIRLYHERWEIETAFLALRHTQLGGHVLRSQDRAGIEQEVWAMLTLYQLLRTAMVEAVESRPGLDPDRASFTTALQTARDQLTAAAGINPDPDPDPGSTGRLGAIGVAVLATLLPARRARYSNRRVKCSTSRYRAHDDDRPSLPTRIISIDIAVHTPPINFEPL